MDPRARSLPKYESPNPAARYWRLPQVMIYTGRSRSRIYADPSFPKPLKLAANTAAWKTAEVIAWCEEREREAGREAS